MLLRLVKLLSVPRLFRDLQEAANLLPSVMRLVMFSFWLAASLHVMAVSWVSIGGSESSRRNDEQYSNCVYHCAATRWCRHVLVHYRECVQFSVKSGYRP